MVEILDRETLVKLCATFGGTTIKIPTIKELKFLVDALGLYYLTDIQHKQLNGKIPKHTLDIYNKLKELMSGYNIG